MKRWLSLVLAFSALGAANASAKEAQVGISAFAGWSVPVLQDVNVSNFKPSDAFGPSGSTWGFRVPVKAIPVVTLEPYYAQENYQDDTEIFNGLSYERQGFDGKSFGVNALLGDVFHRGFKVYPFLGLGKTKLTRTGEEINERTWNFGVGLGFPLAHKISFQIRGQLDMVITDSTSRKFTDATAGIQYNILQ